MSCTIELQIGSRMKVVASGDKPLDIIQTISQFSELPSTCGICQGSEILLRARTAQDYIFYEVVCASCGAFHELGVTKKFTLFPRGDWKRAHERKFSKEDNQSNSPNISADDISF